MAIAPIPIPTIVTERLTLTPLTVADADGMVEVYADQRMHEFTGGAPPGAPQLRERYEQLAVGRNHDGSEQWCNWIVRLHGCPDSVGAMQATVAHDLAGAAVAWEIGVNHQGRGLASEAARAVADWLLASGVERVTATIRPDHAASAGVQSVPVSWRRTRSTTAKSSGIAMIEVSSA